MNSKIYRMLTISISFMVLLTAFPFSAFADEGMFMPDKIATLPLAQKGLKIKPTDIYNPNGGGLTEAVVRLSIGCTGEFVSPEGLILTNHHCGFDALVAASTPEKNYGIEGYRADSRANELPAKGYAVTLTLKSEDVTAQVLQGTSDLSPDKREEAIQAKIKDLTEADKAKLGDETEVQIQALNNGMFYYKFYYYTIKDVRLAYAPPKNIGFFGGDDDNFEWTRHCGDFTFLRAYVSLDGKPAEYSPNNVPYKPKKFLTLSLNGVKENDFTMVVGYPGGTTRYRESFSVAYNQDVRLPFLVEYLDARIKALQAVAQTDATKKVELQAQIFELANTYKAFDGGVIAMKRGNIVGKKQADEMAFEKWVSADSTRQAKYGQVLPSLQNAYKSLQQNGQHDLVLQFLPNAHPAIPLLLGEFNGAPKDRLKNAIPGQLEGNEPIANREMLKFFLRKAAELPAGQKIAAIENLFAGKTGAERIQAEDEFARTASENKFLNTRIGLIGLLELSPEEMKNSDDPFIKLIAGLGSELPKTQQRTQSFNAAVGRYRLPYMQGMTEMKNAQPYPDANFTQRFTYGTVKGFSPREAVTFSPFTTLKGVIEKDRGREPFDVPAKLKELYASKDYGDYAVNGEIPVDFLSTNDIIGGNSGSPIMNANGEQVGIVFDGNFEGLGNDFFVSDDLGRTISVDIRYVLFVTEKFGNAGWLLKEMKISKAAPAPTGKAKGKTAK